MVLAPDGRCVAANSSLSLLSLQASRGYGKLIGTTIHFDTVELRAALLQAVGGEDAVVDTQSPPAELLLSGTWRFHFRPFRVNEERGVALFLEDVSQCGSRGGNASAIDERFRLLVEVAADGILIHRAQILLYLNPEAVRLFGYDSPDQLVGSSISELLAPDCRGEFAARLRAVAAGDIGAQVFETAFLRRGGVPFAAECRATRPPVDEMGTGFLFLRDIGQSKSMRRRRENASRVETLARFSMTIGAELQSYVADLRRWITRTGPRSVVAPEQHAALVALADSMAARADNLLLAQSSSLNRQVAGSSTLEDLVVRICNALRDERETGVRTSAGGYGDDDSRELLIDLEPVSHVVKGDTGAIEAGLTALARTALRSHGRATPLWIRGSRSTTPSSPMGVTYGLTIGRRRFGVAGSLQPGSLECPPGMPSFESWEQGRDLELLGGYCALLSQGCSVEAHACANGEYVFDVELPLDLGHPVAIEDDNRVGPVTLSVATDPESQATGASEAHESPPDTERSRGIATQLTAKGSPAAILICDDEARLAALTAGLLREYGFVVLTVQRGVEAIQAVESHPIDVVVLDVNLPGEDALEIVCRLRSRSRASVILSSGYTEEDIDPVLLHDSAVKAFLAKPYGVELLVQTIERVRLEMNGGTRPGESSGSSANVPSS